MVCFLLNLNHSHDTLNSIILAMVYIWLQTRVPQKRGPPTSSYQVSVLYSSISFSSHVSETPISTISAISEQALHSSLKPSTLLVPHPIAALRWGFQGTASMYQELVQLNDLPAIVTSVFWRLLGTCLIINIVSYTNNILHWMMVNSTLNVAISQLTLLCELQISSRTKIASHTP